MKKITLALTIFCAAVTAGAQTATTAFTVAGIKVIYKPSIKQVVNVSIYFKGGVNNYPIDKAGIESLAVNAATQCGTAKYNKDAFMDKADNFGVSVYGSSNRDYSFIGLNCISQYFNEGWSLLSEAVTNPSFDEGEFKKLKQKAITGLRQAAGNPDAKLSDMSLRNAFAGTAYELGAAGTEETVTKLNAADVKDYYYKTLLNKNRMFIVVVGNISKADITAKITAAFTNLPVAEYKPVIIQAPPIKGNTINIEERKLATNYIQGIMGAPLPASADNAPYRLAFASLNGMLFDEIRTKRNLSYAPAAYASSNAVPYSVVYVTTTDPKAAVEVMANVINGIKKNGFSETDLKDAKGEYITENYMKDESTNAIAQTLGAAEARGNWKMAEELPTLINNTTVPQLNAAFRKYITGIKWNYLGVKAQADDASAAFNMPVAQ